MHGRIDQAKSLFIAALLLAGSAGAASATPINLSSLVNADLTTYTGGNNYPQNGGPLTVAGVSFNLATIAPNNHTAVIQTQPPTSASSSFTIPVGLADVTEVFTLINSAFGACGQTVGSLTFVGNTHTFTYNLTEGTNIRDHFNGVFCNTVTSVAGTASFGGAQIASTCRTSCCRPALRPIRSRALSLPIRTPWGETASRSWLR